MKEQTLREAFERYYLGVDYGKKDSMKALTRHPDGYYIFAAVQHDWNTWQAAARWADK